MASVVSIVGAGSIGAAWAIVFARAGVDVLLYDPDPRRRSAAPKEIRSKLDDLAGFDLLTQPPAAVASRIVTCADLAAAVRDASYVQECAPEDAAVKRELFALLDEQAPARAVLASSSSAIPTSVFAGELDGRSRCLVAHPGNPPFLLPIVELVPAPFTDADALGRSRRLLEEAGMSVVVLRREIEGFVFNRLQGAVFSEAYRLVRDGVVAADDVDRVVRDGLGRRWAFIGPFETADLNTRGGIAAHAARLGPAYQRMAAERGDREPWTPDLVERVVAERRRILPLDRWEDRVAWRDRMLMALERLRRDEQAAPGETRPARARDRLEIESLLYRYCAMLDRMELRLVPSLFIDDCVVVYGDDESMQSRSAAQLAESLTRLWRFARTSHHLSNVEIEFESGDTAISRSYVLAWHQRSDGTSNTLYAEYRDRVVRTSAGWRIAERRQLTHGSDEPWDRPLMAAERLQPGSDEPSG